jgi:hypothetical protein
MSRVGHRAVVSEVHSVRRKLTLMIDTNEETRAQLSDMKEQHAESNSKLQQQLFNIQNEMTILISRLTGTNDGDDGLIKCSKKGCDRVVTKRFRSGKSPRQCPVCLEYAFESKKRKREHCTTTATTTAADKSQVVSN